MDLKSIINGTADIDCVKSGGIVVYNLNSINGDKFQIEIDLSDKHYVGETATFLPHYGRSIILMRWIRSAIENNTIIKL